MILASLKHVLALRWSLSVVRLPLALASAVCVVGRHFATWQHPQLSYSLWHSPSDSDTTIIYNEPPQPDSDDTHLPYDSDETVLPEESDETVLHHDSDETVLPYDSDETVLPYDSDDTVLP